jgi:hypothetical protein
MVFPMAEWPSSMSMREMRVAPARGRKSRPATAQQPWPTYVPNQGPPADDLLHANGAACLPRVWRSMPSMASLFQIQSDTVLSCPRHAPQSRRALLCRPRNASRPASHHPLCLRRCLPLCHSLELHACAGACTSTCTSTCACTLAIPAGPRWHAIHISST